MKKLIFLIFICGLIATVVHSQSCLPEGITFGSQSQIDSFEADYPNCTEIEGDVWVEGPDITNLNGLSVLTKLHSSLTLYYNPLLTSLTGLDNISFIGGIIKVDANLALTSLNGLGNLTSIPGSLIIGVYPQGNPALNELTGLNNLISIGGDLHIFSNVSQKDCKGLNNLESIGGDLYIGGNDSLVNLSGLNNLNSIGATCWFFNNRNLANINDLENLTSIEGDLIIGHSYNGGNRSLANLNGLNNLTSIEGDLIIDSNDSLTSLAGIENIDATSIENLEIYHNPFLSECELESICSYLADPNGTVAIFNNGTGCSNQSEIADSCNITLPCLPFGNYYFFSQAEIDSFQSNFPDCYDLEGRVQISGEDINDLNGLNVVTSINGSLIIRDNTILEDLSGLENLSQIASLYIGHHFYGLNPQLADLSALGNLTSVGERLFIEANPMLTSLEGLENIDPSAITWLQIEGNESLSKCEVQSICDYLQAGNGVYIIWENAPGCNDEDEVITACQAVDVVEVNDTPNKNNIRCYPNFFSDNTTIELVLVKAGQVQLSIYNNLGEQVAALYNGRQISGKHQIKWHADDLQAGVYFCVLRTETETQTTKMIKLK